MATISNIRNLLLPAIKTFAAEVSYKGRIVVLEDYLLDSLMLNGSVLYTRMELEDCLYLKDLRKRVVDIILAPPEDYLPEADVADIASLIWANRDGQEIGSVT